MTLSKTLATLVLGSAALFTAAGVASADRNGGRPRKPPPEAIAACEGRAAGDACTVTLGERTIDGTCRPGPRGEEPLACLPDRPPGPPPEGPPPTQ